MDGVERDEIVKTIRLKTPLLGSLVSDRRAVQEAITKAYAQTYAALCHNSSPQFEKSLDRKAAALIEHNVFKCNDINHGVIQLVDAAQIQMRMGMTFFASISQEEGVEVIKNVFPRQYKSKKAEFDEHLSKFYETLDPTWDAIRAVKAKKASSLEDVVVKIRKGLSLKSCVEYSVMNNIAFTMRVITANRGLLRCEKRQKILMLCCIHVKM